MFSIIGTFYFLNGIAYSTAQRSVQKLELANIIKQTNESKRDTIYCATEILTILEEPTKIEMDFS